MSFRPSDLIGLSEDMVGAEFWKWCGLAISLWKQDPCLEHEFAGLTDFLDFAIATAEKLICSATENQGGHFDPKTAG
jgi:hypothetical protein